jgi:hypothetical protein
MHVTRLIDYRNNENKTPWLAIFTSVGFYLSDKSLPAKHGFLAKRRDIDVLATPPIHCGERSMNKTAV